MTAPRTTQGRVLGMRGAVVDPSKIALDAAESAWRASIELLETATRDVLDGKAGAVERGQRAIQEGSRSAGVIGTLTNGQPNPALQTRWVDALEAFSAASGSYDPDRVVQAGTTGASSLAVPQWVLWVLLAAGLGWLLIRGRGGRDSW